MSLLDSMDWGDQLHAGLRWLGELEEPLTILDIIDPGCQAALREAQIAVDAATAACRRARAQSDPRRNALAEEALRLKEREALKNRRPAGTPTQDLPLNNPTIGGLARSWVLRSAW